MSMYSDSKAGRRVLSLFLVIIYLAAFLAAGIGQWISQDFDWSTVGTTAWWAGTSKRLLLNYVILFSTISWKISGIMVKDEIVQATYKRIKLTIDTKVHPVTFDPYMVEFNRLRKINQHKKNITNKLNKLVDKRSSIKNLALWEKFLGDEGDKKLSALFTKVNYEQDISAEFKKKYIRKRLKLEYRLSELYMTKTLPYIKVRGYKPISKTFVTTGYVRMFGSEDQAPERASVKMFIDLAPKLLITILTSVLFETIVFDYIEAENTAEAIMQTVGLVLPMLLQIYFGIEYAKKYRDEKILVDFRKREEILAPYLVKQGGTHNGNIQV